MTTSRFTPDQIREAVSMIESALQGIPQPRPSFDPGYVDYVIPRTLESSVIGAAEAILERGAELALGPRLEEAKAEGRREAFAEMKAAFARLK